MKQYFKYIALTALLTGLSSHPTAAQTIPLSINYDSLSFIEEPLAKDLGFATANVSLLIDQSAQYDIENHDDDYNSRANGLIHLETQLPNSWTAGVQYFGSYNRLADDEYTDNIAAFISDEWGLVSVGNVTGSVNENTRRRRGTGNANLRFDDFLGGLDETGAFYSVRTNAYQLSVTADQEGRGELGLSYARPIGNSYYFLSLRGRKGHTAEGSLAAGSGDTYGAAVVGSYTYANIVIDSQLGYENIDRDAGDTAERVFGSAGLHHKQGRFSSSVEGHIGSVDGDTETSAAIGARLDLVRGASLNFGYNFADLKNTEIQEAMASLRYEF
ncbi:MAG: hypothetical protein ACQEQL_08980 [Pseudomonadota bacterium]